MEESGDDPLVNLYVTLFEDFIIKSTDVAGTYYTFLNLYIAMPFY